MKDNVQAKFQVLNTSSDNVQGKLLFALTKSPSIVKMSDAVGDTFTVAEWCVYEDADKKAPEKTNTILSVLDTNGVVRATNSNTFTEMFLDIASIMGNTGFDIKVVSGKSKAGRDFITCDMPL